VWLTYIDPTKTLNDVETAVNDPEIQKVIKEARISFQFVMAGNSTDDIQLQDKILDAILVSTGCYKVVSFRQRCLLEESGLFLPWRSREDTAHRGATDV
jgi:hypothetical protein